MRLNSVLRLILDYRYDSPFSSAVPTNLDRIHMTTTETDIATHEWWERYKEVVNTDPEMKVRGHDHFDENFAVTIGDEQYLIKVDAGMITDIVPNPDMNTDWAVGVEGSQKAWEEFMQENPPAHNNEIIASNYRTAVRGEEDHLRLTGSNKTFFQNLRPIQRSLDLMRVAHNKGGS